MRCKMTASLRATATRALLRLLRFAMRMPQALREDHLATRVAFIDLHIQGSLGMPGLDADDRQPALVKLGPKPGRRRAGLKADANAVRGPL